MREYLARVRALKWQALQVRGEQLLPQHDGGGGLPWGFPDAPFCELPEGGMSELSALARGAGAEALLHALLKL